VSEETHRVTAVDRLGDELERAFAVAERAENAKRRRRRRWRVAVLTAVLVVIPPGAIATRSIWEPGPSTDDPEHPRGGMPAVLLEGSGPAERWRLTAFSGPRGTCLLLGLLSGSATKTESCAPPNPRPGTVEMNLINGAQDSFVYGAVRPEVARVVVEAGGRRQVVSPLAPPPEALRRADLEPDFKVYIAAFDEPIDPAAGLRVRALDANGDVVGRFRLGS
jgi:hypothetical protein